MFTFTLAQVLTMMKHLNIHCTVVKTVTGTIHHVALHCKSPYYEVTQ